MIEHYSPERRTALVLTGTAADGAYHAGVLRALHETGIKIDVFAGRGVGVVGAVFAAVGGAARLCDDNGLWRQPAITSHATAIAARATTAAKAFRPRNIADCLSKARSETDTEKFGFVLILLEKSVR